VKQYLARYRQQRRLDREQQQQEQQEASQDGREVEATTP
jgi:hypothetical protein